MGAGFGLTAVAALAGLHRDYFSGILLAMTQVEQGEDYAPGHYANIDSDLEISYVRMV